MKQKKINQEFLGELIEPKCAVVDNQGNHCPDKPEYLIENHSSKLKPVDTIGLCCRCFINYKNGAFDYPKRAKGFDGLIIDRVNNFNPENYEGELITIKVNPEEAKKMISKHNSIDAQGIKGAKAGTDLKNVLLKNMKDLRRYKDCENEAFKINFLFSSIVKRSLILRIKLFFSRLISFFKKLIVR